LKLASFFLHVKTSIENGTSQLTLLDIQMPKMPMDPIQEWMQWAEYPILGIGSICIVAYQLWCRGRKRRASRKSKNSEEDENL